jgi:ABC-2 type transport system ATP-binding protein
VVRDFIEELSGRGRTIFICTHNLDEADRLCDRIGVIKQHLVRVDTPQALRRGLYGQSVLIRLQEVTPELVAAVEALPFVKSVSQADDQLRVALDNPETQNPTVVRALVEAGGAVQFVEREEHSLEEVYFDLMKESQN